MKHYIEKNVYMDPNSGCWIWNLSHNSEGYGQSKPVNGSRKAHRTSWFAYYGTIPSGRLVLHKCDNKCCVNPNHLFLGSHSDNMKDAAKKGLLGPLKASIKLSNQQVAAIRCSSLSNRQLGREYGVSHAQISRIRNHVQR